MLHAVAGPGHSMIRLPLGRLVEFNLSGVPTKTHYEGHKRAGFTQLVAQWWEHLSERSHLGGPLQCLGRRTPLVWTIVCFWEHTAHYFTRCRLTWIPVEFEHLSLVTLRHQTVCALRTLVMGRSWWCRGRACLNELTDEAVWAEVDYEGLPSPSRSSEWHPAFWWLRLVWGTYARSWQTYATADCTLHKVCGYLGVGGYVRFNEPIGHPVLP